MVNFGTYIDSLENGEVIPRTAQCLLLFLHSERTLGVFQEPYVVHKIETRSLKPPIFYIIVLSSLY